MEKQKDMLLHYARREGLEITRFVRVEISSQKSMRERELEFLDRMRPGDILICTETSRLSRGIVELLTIVDNLLIRKIRVIFVLQGLDLRDLDNPTTKLTLHMFSARSQSRLRCDQGLMAEHERSVIS